MQRLIQIIQNNRATLALGCCVLVSLAMMALRQSDKLNVARGVAAGLLRAGHVVFAWPMDIANLRTENRMLREQNLRLSLEVLDLREARLENLRLHELLSFRTEVEGLYLAARVIARDPDRVPNTLLIDVGERRGVLGRMPVITADGLVGRVLEAHGTTAVVQLLLDRNCRVSAVVQREERTQGVVTCENGVLYLSMVPIRAAIDSGDAVVSSGMGEIVPTGLLVGHVASVTDEARGLFREVVLEPSVGFANLEEVFVLKETNTHEDESVTE